jgi:hypothetical protein
MNQSEYYFDNLNNVDLLELAKKIYHRLRKSGLRWEIVPNRYLDENDDLESVRKHLSKMLEENEVHFSPRREEEVREYLFRYPTSDKITVTKVKNRMSRQISSNPLDYPSFQEEVVFDFQTLPSYLLARIMDEIYRRIISSSDDIWREKERKEVFKEMLQKEEEVFLARTSLEEEEKKKKSPGIGGGWNTENLTELVEKDNDCRIEKVKKMLYAYPPKLYYDPTTGTLHEHPDYLEDYLEDYLKLPSFPLDTSTATATYPISTMKSYPTVPIISTASYPTNSTYTYKSPLIKKWLEIFEKEKK